MAEQPHERGATDADPGGPEPRVLVVDDDPDLQQMLGMFLDAHAIPHDSASDGAAALASFDPVRHRAMVLDLMMPIKTGYEVMEELRRRNHGLLGRVIVVTGRGRNDPREIDEGVYRVFEKPYSPKELVATIRSCMAREALLG